MCDIDRNVLKKAFPLAGYWTKDSRHIPSKSEYLLACTSGTIGKCVRFGYKPWKNKNGRSLWDYWDYHQTCVELVLRF
ncbi:MAG: hypothetical protein HQK49_09555 [Oligoflexia bacterium]|nr:hypothetical protein [Oligoflexia bacterium]